jgi:type IV pilus assembly protein PilM
VGIERAAAYLMAQSAGEQISKVFLCGGGARVPGMVEALGARLGVPTKIANPLERIAYHPDVTQSVPLDEIGPMLMLPVGLALRQPR